MDETNKTGRPEPRTEAAIFEDLRRLVQSNGAVHEISNLIFRDHIVNVDMREARVVDDPKHRWSTSKLNKNELLLLLGLAVQSPTDRTYAVQLTRDGFAVLADSLLRELHDRVLVDSASMFDSTSSRFAESDDAIGLFAREAIYYGAEALYIHQLVNFSRMRYMEDSEWLLQNVGISIDSILDIASFIVGYINDKMTAVGHLREQGHHFSKGDLTDTLLIAKDNVRKRFGVNADAFFPNSLHPYRTRIKHSRTPFN